MRCALNPIFLQHGKVTWVLASPSGLTSLAWRDLDPEPLQQFVRLDRSGRGLLVLTLTRVQSSRRTDVEMVVQLCY